MNPMDPDLERAVAEIRGEAVDDAVVEAAAARVWARMAEEAERRPRRRNPPSTSAAAPISRRSFPITARAV